LKPSTRLKVGLRTALRRRYGYAALRVLRRSLLAAIETHRRGQFGPVPYDGATQGEAIYRGYWQGLQRLRRRWPDLDLTDERARP
jgi:hypothetical protein